MKYKNESVIRPSDGEWNNYHLRFINILMTRFGESTGDLATRMGCSKQAINHMLRCDDCMLSRAHDIVEAHNCKLTVKLKAPVQEVQGVTINLEGFTEQSLTTRTGNRLYFLIEAMSAYGYNIPTLHKVLSQKMDVSLSIVRYWLTSADDMYISWIYKIADAMGSEVMISITAMTPEEIKSNVWTRIVKQNMESANLTFKRRGRKPQWLKDLEAEYADAAPEERNRIIGEAIREHNDEKRKAEEERMAAKMEKVRKFRKNRNLTRNQQTGTEE